MQVWPGLPPQSRRFVSPPSAGDTYKYPPPAPILNTAMEDLLSRHQKEVHDLTSRITQKKKGATKKTRKGINTECEALEADLKARHAREIAELEDPDSALATEPDGEEEEEEEEMPETNTTEPKEPTTPNPAPPSPTKKPSRQKARLARRAADLAALSAAAEAEAASTPDRRTQELATMQERLSTLNLTEHAIAPDGHCLYAAFADQMAGQVDYRAARRKCAEFMREHRVDFEPFLEEEFEEHVRKVGETAEWGGQTEVLALAKAYGVVVNVVQAEGRGVERMNEDGDGEVWLGYYRHSFGLGEHYNSLRRGGWLGEKGGRRW